MASYRICAIKTTRRINRCRSSMVKRTIRRQDRKKPKPAVAKPGFPGVPVVLLAVALLVTLGLWWWKFKSAEIPPEAKALTPAKEANSAGVGDKTVFRKLQGQWRRPDGGYILSINNIADSGVMEAAYFNPNPIHVAKAEASQNDPVTRVFIELRDVNYPGSTYTLRYEPSTDQLKGIYYQAVERQNFEVVFERIQ